MRAKTPEQKQDICERLLRAWMCHADLRLGQLLTCVFQGQDIFFLEDEHCIEKIEQWAQENHS